MESRSNPSPSPRIRKGRRLGVRALLALGALVLLASCTPTQMRLWWDAHGIEHSHMSEAEVVEMAHISTNYWNEVFAENAELARFDHVLSPEQLARLRACESSGNYGIVSSTGLYRGAYQFHQGTWDSVARQHLPRYVGLDPAQAPPHVQDGMARALWSMTGPRSWPVCGYRV